MARVHIGTPWKHQGRTADGLDCAGLVVLVWNGLGLPDIDRRDYGPQSDGALLRSILDRHFVRRPDPAPGAVALMIHESARPQHLGIVSEVRCKMSGVRRSGDDADLCHLTSDIWFVHAYASARKVVEHRMAAALRLRPVAFYDFPVAEEIDLGTPHPARPDGRADLLHKGGGEPMAGL